MFRAAALLLALAPAADVPTALFTVSPEHLLVEGVATDGKTIWISSVLDRTILAWRDGRTARIAMPTGTLHPMGIAWDAQRRWLWITTDCPELPGVAKCDTAALVAIDAKGQLKAKYTAPEPLHAGDVSVGGGNVFVSNTRTGAVYRLRPGGKALETLVATGVGRSAQGSALDASGKRLIVADYGRGVASIDLVTGQRTLLPQADGTPLRGLDGLVRVGERYFAIHNGSAPGKLVAFTIGETAIDAAVLVRGGALVDPTQLAVSGDRLLIVGDAGWEAAAKAKPRVAPATILGVVVGATSR